MGKLNELREEIKTVFSGQGGNILDSFIPLALFFLLNSLGSLSLSFWISLSVSAIFVGLRLFQKRNIRYSLAGLGGVGLAAGFVYLNGSETGILIPGLISGGITIVLCLVSVVVKRPLAAWTSYLTRRWPLEWYWHKQIRPAYTEVTIIWAVAFGARTGIENWLFYRQAVNSLGIVKIILGWPYTILILILSYLYGIWRLRILRGPSVAEYIEGKNAPWQGQKRGF